METTQTDPGWLTVGADVVLVTPNTTTGTGGFVRTTIKSLTKRDVVLESGDRVNRERLKRSNGEWSTTTYLYPPDHPEVARVSLANRRSNCAAKIRKSATTAAELTDNKVVTRTDPNIGTVTLKGLLGDDPHEALDNIESSLNAALAWVASYRRILNETTEVETDE